MTTRRVLVVAASVTTACVFPAFLTGALAVQLRRDLDFSTAGTGLGVAAFFGAASLCSALLGRHVERAGPDWGLRVAGIWSGVAQLLIAAVVHSLTALLVLLAVAGAANALCQPAANLLIARGVPLSRQGLAFAVKQSAIPIATMLAGAAVPAIGLTVGWRWAFVGGGALAIASTFTVPSAAIRPAPRVRSTRAERGDVSLPTMALLALGVGLGAASAGTLGAFLVSAAVHTGLRESVAGLTLTVGSMIGLSVRLLAGLRADQRQGGHLRVVSLMLALGAVGYCLFAVDEAWLLLAATPLAFGAGWAWPGLFNLAVVQANPSSPALATGITQTGTYVGAVLGPLVFGFLADHTSYSLAWSVAAATALAAATAMWFARARLRRERGSIADLVEPLPPLPA